MLLGHLEAVSKHRAGCHQLLVLVHADNRDLIRDLGAHVRWKLCPSLTRHWAGRFIWQCLSLPGLFRDEQIDLVISPSGSLCPGAHCPQIVLAQNPWCFVRELQRTPSARLKAALQRSSYRRALQQAAILFCNSSYLSSLYAANLGSPGRPIPVLSNGIDELIFQQAQPIVAFEQRDLEILCVSVMTAHKAIEVLLEALVLIHRSGLPARLRLVGPWAQSSYRRRIEQHIQVLGLERAVLISDQVSEAELHHRYRQARVFALLSRCESFGLPAVEAQAFGTPSVVAAAGAPPDVAGPGARVVPADDAAAAAEALVSLLTDRDLWQSLSVRARRNAERFRWERVAAPLVSILEHWSGADSPDS